MKTIIVIMSATLACCSVTTTTNTLPDGTKVVVVAKSSDPIAINAALTAAEIIAPVVERIAANQKSNTVVSSDK
jgi:hypothetical protein